MSAIAAARRHFDLAVAVLDADRATALSHFREATAIEPAMADAWLGRLAAGDDDLATLEQLHGCGPRLRRETNRLGIGLSAAARAGPYLSINVTDAPHAGVALASGLIGDGQFDRAEALLDDLARDPDSLQWSQYIRCYLMFVTQRWPDLVVEAARTMPAADPVRAPIVAGVRAMAAHAAVHLGQARVALDWADRVELRPHRELSAANPARLVAVDPDEFPLIAADLAYVRGMAHRQLGAEELAQAWLSKASVNGVLTEPARQALADPQLQLSVTDAETIDSRTDKWDFSTGRSAEARAEEGNAERREDLLAEGRALLADQVGLAEVKRAVAELEDQIEVRALRLEHGLPVSSQTNHMLLVGPPGTGKTTTAEALGKIYAGLGIVQHPEIIEVKRSDFCGEHIGSSGPKTNELISRSLGRILFLDEIYSLVERHHDGRPDMIGMEAVNQLLVALEVHRFDFCFIGAGYEKQVEEFLTVNPGLAGRFNRTLRFESYGPDELAEIAARYGRPRETLLEHEARAAFTDACRRLREYHRSDGAHGIDILHNGRFARNVVERAERLRDSRVAALHRSGRAAVTLDDLRILRREDVEAAVSAACAEKHVPLAP
jgi:type VII secretion ATPase EccA